MTTIRRAEYFPSQAVGIGTIDEREEVCLFHDLKGKKSIGRPYKRGGGGRRAAPAGGGAAEAEAEAEAATRTEEPAGRGGEDVVVVSRTSATEPSQIRKVRALSLLLLCLAFLNSVLVVALATGVVKDPTRVLPHFDSEAQKTGGAPQAFDRAPSGWQSADGLCLVLNALLVVAVSSSSSFALSIYSTAAMFNMLISVPSLPTVFHAFRCFLLDIAQIMMADHIRRTMGMNFLRPAPELRSAV